MKNIIKDSFENALYSYDPNEFMPIWSGPQLVNKSSYALYKLRRTGRHARKGAIGFAHGLHVVGRAFIPNP